MDSHRVNGDRITHAPSHPDDNWDIVDLVKKVTAEIVEGLSELDLPSG